MLVCLDPALDKYNSSGSPDGSLFDYRLNYSIAKRASLILEKHGFDTILTRNANYESNLSESAENIRRCKVANDAGADIFISMRTSTQREGWNNDSGFEVWYYPQSKFGKVLSDTAMERAYLKVMNHGIQLKGSRESDIRILRETDMPAISIRFGNCNNEDDIKGMASKEFIKSCSQAVALTVIKYSKMRKTTRENKEAVHMVAASSNKKTSILGAPVLTEAQLDAFVKKVNPKAPSVAKYFISVGKEMGIRGDIAFCQSIKETGYFKYGGDVKASQNNYAGIGAVGGGAGGATFKTEEEGVRAQLQHLWAYAVKGSEPKAKIVDPRYKLVTRGVATTWEDLGGKWAVPGYNKKKYSSFEKAYAAGETYGQEILDIYNQIAKTAVVAPPVKEEPKKPSAVVRQAKVSDITAEIDGKDITALMVDGLGYVRATDLAKVLGKEVIWDSVDRKIIFH